MLKTFVMHSMICDCPPLGFIVPANVGVVQHTTCGIELNFYFNYASKHALWELWEHHVEHVGALLLAAKAFARQPSRHDLLAWIGGCIYALTHTWMHAQTFLQSNICSITSAAGHQHQQQHWSKLASCTCMRIEDIFRPRASHNPSDLHWFLFRPHG